MARIAKALGALEVKRLTEPGLHAVGSVTGLRLSITPTGAKSWILRTTVGTKRSDIGLGSYPGVTLAAAWERARTALDSIRDGNNPIAERERKQAAITRTFKTSALAYIEAFKPSWKNVKHGQVNWKRLQRQRRTVSVVTNQTFALGSNFATWIRSFEPFGIANPRPFYQVVGQCGK
jgi:hypothetical protein